MIRAIRRQAAGDPRAYHAHCDCTGRTGRWTCDKVGPAGYDKEHAQTCATTEGWIKVGKKWYCPECQRDGLVPFRARSIVAV